MCVNITPAAAKFIQRMTRFGGGNAASGFRLSVKSGGCSGFDSSFSIEGLPQAGDTVVEQEGVRVFLPEATCHLLRGYTVDFKETRMDGGLSFSRPGEAQACACSGGSGQGPSVKGVSTISFMRPPSSCSKKAEA